MAAGRDSLWQATQNALTAVYACLTGLHGAKVVITGRRREVLDAAVADLTKSGITATGLQGDVRSPEACQGLVASTVQQFGHLDILVNCAAGNFLANAAELSQGGFKTGKSNSQLLALSFSSVCEALVMW